MKGTQVERERWTPRELENAVEVYRRMLRHEVEGHAYSKSEMRREALAGPLQGRSPSSFEFRMRNISAVLEELGRSTVKGYAPAKHVARGRPQRFAKR
jgi:5-methylcytosine-specific restriction protein A